MLEADRVVAERFRMVRELGRGGMGSVWLAHHLSLDVPCAVKFVDEKLTAPGFRERFEAEARAAARLKGPHVVQILDHGVWEGHPYIAMELLEGEDLAAGLHRATRFTPAETATVITHVARALTRAHTMGVVHRDLKPANIFLTKDDEGKVVAKVLDFGIAKITEPSLKRAPDTIAGQLLGTPEYMSPEQLQGREVDFRTDLWALAVIAFECLTGTSPFRGDTLYTVTSNVVHNPIPVPSERAPGVSARIDAWWARAVQRIPTERFSSAREMATSLCLALGVTADEGRVSGVVAPAPQPVAATPTVMGISVSRGVPVAAADTAVSGPTRLKRKRSRIIMASIGLGVVGTVWAVVHAQSSHPPPSLPGQAVAGIAQPITPTAAVVPPAAQAAPTPVEAAPIQAAAAPTVLESDLEPEVAGRSGAEAKTPQGPAHRVGPAKHRASRRSDAPSNGSSKGPSNGSWDPGF